MRPFHRGAYEHLWAEQKYAMMASSFEAYQSLAGRFPQKKAPRVLSLLRHLSRLVHSAEKPERMNALLNAYGHVKSHVSREQRRFMVEGLLANNPATTELLYETVLANKETFLYGCRLFFPQPALYKFWDFDFLAGLWLCLGPFLALVTPACVRARLEAQTALPRPILDQHLLVLKTGLAKADYEALPALLKEALEVHGAVAIAGNKVFLHPRFPLPLPVHERASPTLEEIALFALETCWDKNPAIIPKLPPREDWRLAFCQNAFHGGVCPSEGEIKRLWTALVQGFEQQAKNENFTFNQELEVPRVPVEPEKDEEDLEDLLG